MMMTKKNMAREVTMITPEREEMTPAREEMTPTRDPKKKKPPVKAKEISSPRKEAAREETSSPRKEAARASELPLRSYTTISASEGFAPEDATLMPGSGQVVSTKPFPS